MFLSRKAVCFFESFLFSIIPESPKAFHTWSSSCIHKHIKKYVCYVVRWCKKIFYCSMEWLQNSVPPPCATAAPCKRTLAFVFSVFPIFVVTIPVLLIRTHSLPNNVYPIPALTVQSVDVISAGFTKCVIISMLGFDEQKLFLFWKAQLKHFPSAVYLVLFFVCLLLLFAGIVSVCWH